MTENTEVALNKEQLEKALELLEENDLSGGSIYVGKGGFGLISLRTHRGAGNSGGGYNPGYWVYDLVNHKGEVVHSSR